MDTKSRISLICTLCCSFMKHPSQDSYDTFVQAKISDLNEHPELRKLLLKHMIHSPFCSSYSGCWENDTFSKQYQKPFNRRPRCSDDSYPIYRRIWSTSSRTRVDLKLLNGWYSRIHNYWGCPIDISMVCSYAHLSNPSNSTSSIPGRGVIRQFSHWTEKTKITQHLTGRCISSSEAVVSIFGFQIHAQELAIVCLQVHLP